MSQILEKSLIEEYKSNGAVLIKRKFDESWINKLKEGIRKKKKILAQDLKTIQKIKTLQVIMKIFGHGI